MRSALIAYSLAASMVTPLSGATAGQDGPQGIAFVQAPEQSYGVAMGPTPQSAFAAATARCVDGGAVAEDCIPTNWCFPAGWSVAVSLMHQEGFHWREAICGLPSEAAALSTVRALCAPGERPGIIECVLSQVFDPQGNPQLEN